MGARVLTLRTTDGGAEVARLCKPERKQDYQIRAVRNTYILTRPKLVEE